MARVDLDRVLNDAVLSVWGDAVTYDPRASQPNVAAFAITAVFDEAHEVILEEIAASELSAAGHSTTMPVLEVQLSQFAARPQQTDRVTIAGRVFQVWDVRPDGAGMADLILREIV